MHFGLVHVGGRVDDLPLQVGHIDDVVFDDADAPDAGRCQIKQHGGAKAAGAHYQYAGILEFLLPGAANLGEDDVPGISEDFFFAKIEHAQRAPRP